MGDNKQFNIKGFNQKDGKPSNPNRKKGPEKKGLNIMWLVYVLLFGGLVYMWMTNSTSEPLKKEWADVKEQIIPGGDIEKIVFIRNEKKGEIYINKNKLDKYDEEFGGRTPKGGPQYYFLVSDAFNPENELGALRDSVALTGNRFDIVIDQKNNYWGKTIEWLSFPIMLILMWLIFFRPLKNMGGGAGGQGGIFSVGKSQAKLFDKGSGTKVTFKDVAGLEEAKVEVMEIVDFLKNPKKYTALGGKIPKGALLVGPPGTGKTLLAKAVAGEADVPFFSISGSDFVEMFVGVGASRVRDLFRQAKEKAPCIVFIDEIDAVGRARSKNGGFTSNDERENTLNQLLTEMDGFGSNSGVIILAATNRADILDKALMRAGRFDRQIHVELPELKERLEIFKVHLKGLKLVDGFSIDFLAKQTPGFSGADIANVCNEAALIAARKNKSSIDKQDFLDAIDRIVGGLERKSKIITPEEKKSIAYHEAGHATVSWLLPNANPLLKVTIIPRGQALGAAWYLPEERQLTTVDQIQDEMASLIAGRVAEEMLTGKYSTGALSDLEKLTKHAYAMVKYFGMGNKLTNVSFYDSTGQAEMGFTKPYSDKTAELIDAEVKVLIDKAHATAVKVLKENKEGFEKLAEMLLEREVIFSEDLETVFGPRRGGLDPNKMLNDDTPIDTEKKELLLF